AVVGEHAGADEGGVLGHGGAVIGGDGGVVDRIHGDGDGGRVRDGAQRIDGPVGEAVGAVEVGGGGIGVGAVGVEDQGAVAGGADGLGGHGRAVFARSAVLCVAFVGEHAR